MSNWKTPMRLVEYLDKKGAINEKGQEKLLNGVALAKEMSEQFRCEAMLPFATSALRSAENSEKVLGKVEKETGVRLRILSGDEEARLTFLAVRRWYGWSAGRICDLDIGGGSLEMSIGTDEDPDVACSVNLGAGRLTREWFDTDPPSRKKVKELGEFIDEELNDPVEKLLDSGDIDLAVGTSKTFRMLARLTGAAPSSAGPRVKRTLTQAGLRQLIAFISRMTAADRAELEGVSAERSHQIVAGALVAEAAMRKLDINVLHMCPWALREGVIFRQLDHNPNLT
ncbi:Ppx/GppA phosphatase family protein [Corynebacterium jeikeium]|nr:Ppx/GppA phosphatase family protein [Corynebacterium jeikeium ATCC 43734]WCZ54566.1 Exopolyphosphatase [Corynebacterium jeikeium]SCX23892.1 Exopolyphosphatase [Corynebacterium jeikeium]SUY82332.1 exopolyphosphatase [Corynebacterium jeikeium]